MRASYALPGIFPPVALDGRWLVDGALVNPVPVSAARVFGARLVIAVNLNTDILGRSMIMAGDRRGAAPPPDPPPERRGLRAIFGAEHALKRQFAGGTRRPGIPTVMVDAFNIMQDRITRARLAGDPPDVMISPRARPRRLVRFPPRAGGDRSRRPRRRARARRDRRGGHGARATAGGGDAGREIDAQLSQAVWM